MKACLFYTILLLCACVAAANAESLVVVDWASPTSNNLYSVRMVAASDGWAVGSAGTIVRWDGTEWSTWTNPIPKDLASVFMLNDDDGWAVGLGATLRWNGTTWNDVKSPTEAWLTAVFMLNGNAGWTVSNAGMIFRWNGTDWNNCASPTTERLLSLSMASETSGWAVGYDGTIIRWTGTEWIPEFSAGMLMLLLAGFTLVSVMLAGAASRRGVRPASTEGGQQ